jgi:hypothetical protein
VLQQRRGGSGEHDPPGLQHVATVGDRKRDVRVLLDDQDRDAGLVNLKELENLTTLNLSNTAVTDAGLDALVGLKKLKNVNVSFCPKVTSAGVAKLQKALPSVKITR